MWPVTERSQPISLFHRALVSADMGSRRRCSPNTEAANLAMVEEGSDNWLGLKEQQF
jgi:hypothetical protein